MPGPLPAHPSQRRRRNRAPEMLQLPAEGSGLEAPELPGEAELSEWARNYWVSLWSSPMAVVWIPMDVPGLVRLTRLQDRFMLGDASAAELAEIRQLEDRFGLSPGARARLRMEIPRSRPADGGSGETRSARSAASGGSGKRRLRAV